MTDLDLDPLATGRPVRLVPTAPGFWRLTMGVVTAALAPLFGFLAGVMAQRPESVVLLSPIYLGLLVGVVVGGFGVLLAVLGGIRIWRHNRSLNPAEAAASEAVA